MLYFFEFMKNKLGVLGGDLKVVCHLRSQVELTTIFSKFEAFM